MEKLQFFPLDVSYKVINNKAVIILAARTIDNKQILIFDENFEPYFYVIPKKDNVKEKLEKIKIEYENETAEVTKVEAVQKKHLGKEVKALKVYTKLPRDIPKIRDVIKDWEIIELITEYDILFQRRYLIDKKIIPLTLTEAEGDFITQQARVPVFSITKIEQPTADLLPNPRILAFDIETYSKSGEIDSEKNPIIMISFYGDKFKKIITWKKFDTKQDIEFVDSELALIEKFKEIIEQYKPDILTGYYSDGFDFPYIDKRATKYKIKLDLGLDFSELKITHRQKSTSSRVFSLLHIDIYKFIKRILGSQLDTELYGLNQVAAELLGEKKLEVDLSLLSELWDSSDPKLDLFAKYNLNDAYLTYKLTHKLLTNIIELMKIVGLTLYDINRMGFSQLVEWYLLKNESNFNEIAPDFPHNEEIKQRRSDTFKGGFVFEPKPGLYENIMVFDFRSLYPSIISSHNISPGTRCCSCCQNEGNIPPESNQWFCMKKKGFIPAMMEDLIKRRMRIKEIAGEKENPLLEARLTALKLLANSFYGYLGFFAARWYSLDCVKAITAYGRYYIHKVIDEAEKAGFKVIYSDTDSVFLTLGEKTKQDASSFLEEINSTLPGVMELEYEGSYQRGIFVSVKSGLYGAKKKYALLDEADNMKIRGFETVRRNWSPIAKEVQENILSIILKENNKEKALKYIKNIIKEFKNKSIDNNKLIIHTQLQKDIESYETVGPHVAIASKMRDRGIIVTPGTIIKYIITEGKEKIRDKAALPEDIEEGAYDSDYYIKHQIIPAISQIFEVLGYPKEELVEGKDQKKLSSFK